MSLFVSFQTFRLPERFPTLVARVFLLSRVHQPVSVQRPGLRERFPAAVAGEGPLSGVNAAVKLQAVLIEVFLLALVTGEQRPRVQVLVESQTTLCGESLVTALAPMPDVVVDGLLMMPEAGLIRECFPALSADVASDRGVSEFVIFQLPARGEHFSARFAAVDVLQHVHPLVSF